MKIKDFLKLFDGVDENLDIKIVSSYTEHYCGDGEYCYCGLEDHFFYISNLEKRTEYNKKRKAQETIGMCVRVEKEQI
jgi:hypothetical protein